MGYALSHFGCAMVPCEGTFIKVRRLLVLRGLSASVMVDVHNCADYGYDEFIASLPVQPCAALAAARCLRFSCYLRSLENRVFGMFD